MTILIKAFRPFGFPVILGCILVLSISACTTAPYWETTNTTMDSLLDISSEVIPFSDPADLSRTETKRSATDYLIGSMDILSVNLVADESVETDSPGLAGEYHLEVQDDGSIELPGGKVSVAGMTTISVSELIETLYRESTQADIQADVQVSVFRSQPLVVEGEVLNPGMYYLQPGLVTIGDALKSAGGTGQDADITHLILKRGNQRYQIFMAGAEPGGEPDAIRLQAGDNLHVPSLFPETDKEIYYVFGEVLRQGVFRIPPQGVSILQGIARAGGASMTTGNMDTIFLIRAGDNGNNAKIFRLRLADIISRPDVPLIAGDRLFIRPTGLATWDRTWRQFLPMFSGALAGTTIYDYHNDEN